MSFSIKELSLISLLLFLPSLVSCQGACQTCTRRALVWCAPSCTPKLRINACDTVIFYNQPRQDYAIEVVEPSGIRRPVVLTDQRFRSEHPYSLGAFDEPGEYTVRVVGHNTQEESKVQAKAQPATCGGCVDPSTGRSWGVGQTWTRGCENCRCAAQGKVRCERQRCPRQVCPRQFRRREPGQCCETCIPSCWVSVLGRYLREGSTWDEDCHSCTCTKSVGSSTVGEQICLPYQCPAEPTCPLTQTLLSQPERPGQCCRNYTCYDTECVRDRLPLHTPMDVTSRPVGTCECEKCSCKNGFKQCQRVPEPCNPENPPAECGPKTSTCTGSNGQKHEDQTRWVEGCDICQCRRGTKHCAPHICPTPVCRDSRGRSISAVTAPGRCCPECPKCPDSPSGSPRLPGSQWFDGCSLCTCSPTGKELCSPLICPRSQQCGADQQEREIPLSAPYDMCCAAYHTCVQAPRTTPPPVTTAVPTDVCIYEGVTRREGESWQGRCGWCICYGPFGVVCDAPTNCPAIPDTCSDGQPPEIIVDNTTCCQQYKCPVCECDHQGELHSEGDVWLAPGGCQECRCHRCKVQCRKRSAQTCPEITCPSGSRPVKVEGDCCPSQCVGNCPDCGRQVYNVTLTTSFNRATHRRYPSNGRIGTMFFFSHTSDFSLFAVGKVANEGVASLATFNGVSQFKQWFLPHEDKTLFGMYNLSSPNTGHGQSNNVAVVEAQSSFFSSVARIEPSPDWFVGASALDLCDGSSRQWKRELTVPLIPYDAGADRGRTFFEKQPQIQWDPIVEIFQVADLQTRLQFQGTGGVQGAVEPLGTLEFKLLTSGCA